MIITLLGEYTNQTAEFCDDQGVVLQKMEESA
jgi:hypothetical protein